MPNGEQKLLEYDKKAKEYQDLLKQSEAIVEENRKKLDEFEPVNFNVDEFLIRQVKPGYKRPAWFETMFGRATSMGRTEKLAASQYQAKVVGVAKENLIKATDDIEKNLFYASVYGELPGELRFGKITSLEGALAAIPMPPSLTDAERAEVMDVISGMLGDWEGVPYEQQLAEAARDLDLTPLVAPTAVPSTTPVGLHQLSVAEIAKAIGADRRPRPIMSPENYAELLAGMGIESDEEAESLADLWVERQNMLEAFKAGVAEMPEYKLTDALKEAAVMPGLVAMELAGLYFEHVSMPLAGGIYKNMIPDLEAEYQRLRKTEDTWMALSHAWDNWECNWFLKYVVMESLVDPLSYVGWGIATKITRPIPVLGRLVGAAERGAMQVMEIPFDAVKSLTRKLPKTMGQRALGQQQQAGRVMRKYLELYTGDHLVNMNMTMVDEATKAATAFAIKHPQSQDIAALAGRELLKHIPVGPEEVTSWATRLGTTLSPEHITRATIENVDNVFEDYFMKRMITEKEAGGRLLGILYAADTSDAKLELAQRIIANRASKIKAGAHVLGSAASPFEAMQGLMRRNYKIAFKTEESLAYRSRMEAGRMTVLLHDIDINTQRIWAKYIDKLIVKPFAEAYLTFGMYGPMNVMEDYIRSTLGGVFPGRMHTESWMRLTVGLDVPPGLTEYGISEMTGYLQRVGAEADWNNWILQLAAGGQKKWGAKMYDVLVRRPGNVGMDVRRNFYGGKFQQVFTERGGPEIMAVMEAGGKPPRWVNKKLGKQVEAEVFRMKTTGNPDALSKLKDVFTVKKLTRAEVQNSISQFPDIPPGGREHVMRAYDRGELYRDMDKTFRETKDILTNDFLKSPEYATEQIKALSVHLTEMNVTNPQEMAQAIRMLDTMCTAYGALPHQVIAMTTIRSRGIPVAQRSIAFNKDFDQLYKFLDDSGVNIKRVIDKLNVDVPGLALGDEYTKATRSLLDVATARKEYAAEFRSQNMVLRREIFDSTPPAERTQEWWDDFGNQMVEDWNVFDIKDIELYAQQEAALVELSNTAGAKPFDRPAISVKGRPLAPQDVGRLIGCRGDDLSQALLEVLAINDKRRFVAYVMAKTRAGDIGFTDEAVGAVYDQILHSMRIKPEACSYITRCELQIEGLRKSLWDMRNANLYPDVELQQVYKYLDDTAEAVDKLMYKPAPPIEMPARVPQLFDYTGSKGEMFGQIAPEIGYVKGNLIDPFFGSGAVPVGAYKLGNVGGKIIAQESSADVRHLWKVASNKGDELSAAVKRIYDAHGGVIEAPQAIVLRNAFNAGIDNEVERAATWLIMSRHALYKRLKYNAAGKINSSMRKVDTHFSGKYTPQFASELDDTIKAAAGVKVQSATKESYLDMIREAKPGDVIYLDPPYTGRTLHYPGELDVGPWGADDLTKMLDEAIAASNRGVRVVLSESKELAGRLEGLGFAVKKVKYPKGQVADEVLATIGPEAATVTRRTGVSAKAAAAVPPTEAVTSPTPKNLTDKIATVTKQEVNPTDAKLFKAYEELVAEQVALDRGPMVSFDAIAKRAGVKLQSEEMASWIDRIAYGYNLLKGERARLIQATKAASQPKSVYVNTYGDKIELLSQEKVPFGMDNYRRNPTYYYAVEFNSEALDKELGTLAAKAVSKETKAATLVTPGRMLKPEYANFQEFRQSCMDEAQKWYLKEYPDYDNANFFDAMMKAIFPYWTYESQRWFWLPRSFIRHPGTFTALERYKDNTDYGYIHLPGTSVDANLTRGTVYGCLTTRLSRRDYPEYYDSYGPSGKLVEFMDYISRFGFYPGAHVGGPLALLGGTEPQMGETMPAVWKTPLMAAIAAFPDNESVKFISEKLFNDRFRDYMVVLMVNKRGGDGPLIWSKMSEGVELTPEEQQLWTESRQEAAIYGVGMEQFGTFRLRTDEQYRVYEEAGKVIEEMTGFTPKEQDWMRRHGVRIWDEVGGMSFTQEAILQEMDYHRWVGLNAPVLPGRQQEVIRKIELYWDDVAKFSERQNQQKLTMQKDFTTGLIGPDEYINEVRGLYAAQRTYMDELHQTNLYKVVPVTFEERKAMYVEHDVIVPVLHPSKELRNLYFEVELLQKIDEETGEKVWDWDSFWIQREAIEAAVPDEFKAEWEDYLSRNTTPLEQIRRQVSKEYFRTYNRVWEQVLATQYSVEEQRLIKEWYSLRRRGIQLDRQAEISGMVRPNGHQLISNFQSDSAEAKRALRYANPGLDAWLMYWGKTTAFLTPQAGDHYTQICKETGRRI